MRSTTTRSIGAIAGFCVLAAAITVTILALASGQPAGAGELERFASCAELEAWTDDVQATSAAGGDDVVFEAIGGAMDEATAAAPQAAGAGSAGAGRGSANLVTTEDGDTGGTNTVVAGVDEIDVIDRVDTDRVIVSRQGAVSLVDLGRLEVVDSLTGFGWDARVSVDGTTVWVVGSSRDGMSIEVHRLRVDADALTADGTWRAPGMLLDARRSGDRLHVVAVDYAQGTPGDLLFEGGPVPCDEVWRPVDPATTPAATLVASLPKDGTLEPIVAAEVTGAAGNLLVTDDSVYLATETWSGAPGGTSSVQTGLHHFDLETLSLTGSGVVPGTLAGPFAINEHEDSLRVATSLVPSFRAIPIEGDVLIDDSSVARPTEAPPGADAPRSLAEVFVLDTEGALDLLGRTGLFGHDGETIHGVRFVGDVAYVVTFLQTDPFWVVDLASPSAPTVVGELEIPGFSAYLHPLGDGRVVGFGPDGSGQIAARLFDVSDPTEPTVLAERALGQDSPVVWDHHAFVVLEDGRFAVPVNDYPTVIEERCAPVPVPLPEPLPVEPDGGVATAPASPPIDSVCNPTFSGGAAGVAVLGLDDGRLPRPEKLTVPTDGSIQAERALLAPDGTWLLLSSDRLVPVDGTDALVLPSDPSIHGG